MSQMEENKAEDNAVLSFWDQLSASIEQRGRLSDLFPPLDDDYFRDKPDILQKPLNPIESAIKKYNDLPVKPYIRRRNLNGDGEDSKDKSAWEIGISIDF